MSESTISVSLKDVGIVKELIEIVKDLTRSYEYFTYCDMDKPEEEYDEYDMMVAPVWRRLHSFIEKYDKEE